MKLVVTGANGLIGRRFLEAYSDKYKILALTRSESLLGNPPNKAIWRSTDYSVTSLVDIFSDADAVLHLASVRPYAKGDCYLGNITLDRAIFEAAAEVHLKNMTYLSSCSVYGSMNAPWLESDEVIPETEYALSKASSEMTAKFFNAKADLKIKVIRLAQVFTHDEYEGGLLNTFFQNASLGQPLSVSVKGLSREYIYIKDVVAALHQVVQNNKTSGVFNLGSGELASVRTIGEIIVNAFSNHELLKVDNNRKVIDSLSLMSSEKFYREFNWSPKFSLQDAAHDIYTNFYEKADV
ncbi:MAG: NAD(P)-dependent oxidoreductase [Vibrionaceae bacterium]|nr:NAD(P)-dependent oxidoreductase [Vibrionaceae bacterium]